MAGRGNLDARLGIDGDQHGHVRVEQLLNLAGIAILGRGFQSSGGLRSQGSPQEIQGLEQTRGVGSQRLALDLHRFQVLGQCRPASRGGSQAQHEAEPLVSGGHVVTLLGAGMRLL